jgi:hypothetical protein
VAIISFRFPLKFTFGQFLKHLSQFLLFPQLTFIIASLLRVELEIIIHAFVNHHGLHLKLIIYHVLSHVKHEAFKAKTIHPTIFKFNLRLSPCSRQ